MNATGKASRTQNRCAQKAAAAGNGVPRLEQKRLSFVNTSPPALHCRLIYATVCSGGAGNLFQLNRPIPSSEPNQLSGMSVRSRSLAGH